MTVVWRVFENSAWRCVPPVAPMEKAREGITVKVAVIGSRRLKVVDLSLYLPADTTEIVSGGACGVDRCAAEYAVMNGLKLTEFRPQYQLYGRSAPLRRNVTIVEYSDCVLAFWDGRSRGTAHVVRYCLERNKPLRLFLTADQMVINPVEPLDGRINRQDGQL